MLPVCQECPVPEYEPIMEYTSSLLNIITLKRGGAVLSPNQLSIQDWGMVTIVEGELADIAREDAN